MERRFSAAASGHRRRQLYRARIRPDVPPLRQRGHDRRDGAAADPARGRGRLRGGQGHPGARRHRMSGSMPNASAFARRGDEHRRSVDCTDGPPRSSGSHLLLAVGRRPNTDDLGLDKAGRRAATSAATSSSTTSCAPTCPGIWALGDCNGKGAFTHTVLQRFRDRRGQSARQRSAPGQRPHHRLCASISIRRWAAPG